MKTIMRELCRRCKSFTVNKPSLSLAVFREIKQMGGQPARILMLRIRRLNYIF